MENKLSYRKAIYNYLLRIDPDSFNEIPFEEFCRDCFYHPTGDEKRLRQYGCSLLRNYFPSYYVEWQENIVPEQLPSKHLYWLTKYCKQAYYIGRDKIIFFDEDDALIFKLCDSDMDIVKEVTSD